MITDLENKHKVLRANKITSSTTHKDSINKDYTAFCKKHSVSKKVRINHEKITCVSRLINSCFEIISEQMLERPGGVHIHNFGYFCILQRPKRKAIKYKNRFGFNKENFNVKTKSFVYNPVFIPVKHIKNSLSVWSMDRTFNKTFRMKLRRKLRAGVRYKNYIHSLSTSLKQQSSISKFKGKSFIDEIIKNQKDG